MIVRAVCCLVMRSEKHKNLKLILSIARKLVYIYTKQGSGFKKSNLGHFPMRKWPIMDYEVHGIQIDRLGLTVSTQKLVLKNLQRVPRYRPKSAKFCWFGLEGQFWTLFGRYLGTRCIFFKTDFCVETVSSSWSI